MTLQLQEVVKDFEDIIVKYRPSKKESDDIIAFDESKITKGSTSLGKRNRGFDSEDSEEIEL